MEGYFLTTVRLYLRWRRLGTIYGNDFLPKSSKLAIASENPRRSPSSVLPLSNGAYNNSNFVGDESAPHAKSDENLQDDDARIPVVHANDDDFELATVFDEGGVEGSEKLEQGQFAQDTIDFSDFVLLEMSESLFPRVLTEVTWKKRFCTIHDEGFLSYRLRKEQLTGGRHQRFVDLSADEGIKILNADIFEFSIGARHPCCRTFKFRANDKATFSSVTIRLLEVSVQYKRLSVEERRSKALAAM